MTRFPVKIKREVSYVEDLEAIIVADTRDKAIRIAEGFGDGEMPNWPDIDRYTVNERTPHRHECLDVEVVEDRDIA